MALKRVAAGHYVDTAEPNPDSIEIHSIASALSKICRFGGHCPRFYSVAEHCIHATNLAVEDGLTEAALRAVFLHDAAEAYIGDMVKPLKLLMPQYTTAELRFEKAIEKAFEICFHDFATTIKHFDWSMLKAEKIAMWPDDSANWEGFNGIQLRFVPFQYWTPDRAEQEFLELSESLGLIR